MGIELLQTCRRHPFPSLPAKWKRLERRHSMGLVYFESSLEIKSLPWSTVALPNPRAPGYHKTNLSDAELSSNKRLLLYQHAHITWVVCVQMHTCVRTHFSVPLASGLQAGELRVGACRCDHCLPSEREAVGAISRAGTVCDWLMLPENYPVHYAKSLSWAILGRGSVEKVTVEPTKLRNRGWKIGSLFNFAEPQSHFSENYSHPVRAGDARREEIWLVAAGFLARRRGGE